MIRITDFLITMDGAVKLQEELLKQICVDYGISMTEAKVMSFLRNNPGKDTAAEIVRLRRMQKGNVSAAVDSLVARELLQRETDSRDRRKVHLHLTKKAEPILAAIDSGGIDFRDSLFSDIPAEEIILFEKINRRIGKNAQQALKRRKV